jgi:hypothetical protein
MDYSAGLSLWPGGTPSTGSLTQHALEVLCPLLRKRTKDAKHCFAVWIGWGGLHKSVSAPISLDDLRHPALVLPHREYVVLTGPLSAAVLLAASADVRPRLRAAPNLFWPADRAWFAGSDVDIDSTVIGGTAELIQTILETPELIGPDDSLAADADHVNTFPD